MATIGAKPLAVNVEPVPGVGERAPDFFVDTHSRRASIAQLAQEAGTIVLVSLDSYRYHPG